MTSNPHFETASSWQAARAMLGFVPLELPDAPGRALRSLCVHVRDHKLRELAVGDRTLEAHYGAFVFSQARRGTNEARRLALDVSYGPAPREARIGHRDARVYDLGPVPPPDDIDGRSPSVVAWHDGEMFYLMASGELPSGDLLAIAGSLYA